MNQAEIEWKKAYQLLDRKTREEIGKLTAEVARLEGERDAAQVEAQSAKEQWYDQAATIERLRASHEAAARRAVLPGG